MPITRNRVLVRARYGWPQKTVPFHKTGFHQPDGYRTDAAGYLSMCWDIPLGVKNSWGGLSTVSMDTDGWCHEIDPMDLKSGDALGLLGHGSVGPDGGTIVLFESWLNGDYTTNYAITWEMLPDASPGPVRRQRPYEGHRWHSYRFRDIVDD